MINKILANNTLSVLILAAVIVAACVLVLNLAFRSTMDGIEWQETTYRVQPGDSLWAISGDYCPDSVDRREWIDEVQALNGLKDSIIHPGQKLTVLAPVE